MILYIDPPESFPNRVAWRVPSVCPCTCLCARAGAVTLWQAELRHLSDGLAAERRAEASYSRHACTS